MKRAAAAKMAGRQNEEIYKKIMSPIFKADLDSSYKLSKPRKFLGICQPVGLKSNDDGVKQAHSHRNPKSKKVEKTRINDKIEPQPLLV